MIIIVGIELFAVSLYYPFYVYWTCSDAPSFISNIDNLCPFFLFNLTRGTMPENVQTTVQLCLFHMLAR